MAATATAAKTVLIVNRDPDFGEAMRQSIDAHGLDARVCREISTALRFVAGDLAAAVVVDAEQAGDELAAWCAALRRHRRHRHHPGRDVNADPLPGGGDRANKGNGEDGNNAGANAAAGELPIIALARSTRLGDAEKLFDLGVSDCVAKPVPPGRLAWKLERCLKAAPGGNRRQIKNELGDSGESGDPRGPEPAPEFLREIFARVGRRGARLGEVARINSGVSVRHPTFRRMAPPTAEWLGLLDADSLGIFRIGRPSWFVKFTPEALARRPAPGEFRPEKVLVRRVAPPVAAAVDDTGQPFGADLLGVIAGPGINNGYLACVLNSRLANFWFNRLWERGARGGATTLSAADLGALPLAMPSANDGTYFHRAAKLMAFYGPRPASSADRRRREELWREVNARLFALFGFDERAVGLLGRSYF